MSTKHPIISVTGSSGAGTTSVRNVFEQIFRREQIEAAFIDGDAFHRYDRAGMKKKMAEAGEQGDHAFSHFGPEANLLQELSDSLRSYGESGAARTRHYVHDAGEAQRYGADPGTFTGWEDLPTGSDLLLYEGLHGAVVHGDIDTARHADLKIGVVPVINLEWIQKIHRDNAERGYSPEAVVDTIMRRMPDYITHITPQFSRTDINFQRVSLVDTSNPFIARDIPTPDESFVVIRFTDPNKFNTDFPYLLSMICGSFMSRRNSIVVPGGKMSFAMEIIFGPIIHQMMMEQRGV